MDRRELDVPADRRPAPGPPYGTSASRLQEGQGVMCTLQGHASRRRGGILGPDRRGEPTERKRGNP